MANFGMVSEWHGYECTQDLDTFCGILKKGDIVQMKNFLLCTNFWAVCTQEGQEPKMANRAGSDFFLFKPGFNYEEGSVREFSLDELRKTSSIRVNNFRDRLTPPKEVDDIVHCAMGADGTEGGHPFGQYHEKLNSNLEFVEIARYPKVELDNRLDSNGCSPWHTEEGLDFFKLLLRVGDLVEFDRKNVYSHWAVCIRRPIGIRFSETLVHRYGSGDAKELVMKLIGTIMKSRIEEVIKGSKFRINNSGDHEYKPKEAMDIMQFALDSVGSNAFGKYHLAFNNCWHFAMQARYRVKIGRNTELLSEWYSSEEAIGPLLSSGDIIEFGGEHLHNSYKCQELAIYIECANKTPEVAHLSPSKASGGKTVVCLTSKADFFSNVVKDKDVRINNQWDHTWKPKEGKDIVKSIYKSMGKEDPLFVFEARYGMKAKGEMRRRWLNERYLYLFRTQWLSSAEEFRPLLHVGDVIELRDPNSTQQQKMPDFAIYIERVKSARLFAWKRSPRVTPEVAHLCESRETRGASVVRLTSLEAFFKDVAQNKEFRINNYWDIYRKPNNPEGIVKSVLKSVGKKEGVFFAFDARYMGANPGSAN